MPQRKNNKKNNNILAPNERLEFLPHESKLRGIKSKFIDSKNVSLGRELGALASAIEYHQKRLLEFEQNRIAHAQKIARQLEDKRVGIYANATRDVLKKEAAIKNEETAKIKKMEEYYNKKRYVLKKAISEDTQKIISLENQKRKRNAKRLA